MLPSLNVPVALKPCLVPGAIVLLDGETVMDDTVALVTVSVAVVVVAPSVAVIVVVPGASPFTMPVAPPIVATDVIEELQVTCVVRVRVPPSLNVPTAVSFRLVFGAIVGLAGVMASDARFAEFTASEVFPLINPEVAVIVTVPRFRPDARPLTVIEATLLADEAQVTVPVMS